MNRHDDQNTLQHFILTRFNILIWNKDKEGRKVRTIKWLKHRITLFENYCLPSIKNQTCKNFEWIVLFDSTTPEIYKNRIVDYQKLCPQLIPVFVTPEEGRYFSHIFRNEIVKHLNSKGGRVLTTYLDNDDALNKHFVEDLQRRALSVSEGTFINYNDGYQYYSEKGFLMLIHYPTNHFVSVVEKGDATTVKGIFGYGSHAYIHQIKDVNIKHVKGIPMWCEVVHEKNMINDAYFLNAKMVKDVDLLRREFAFNEDVKFGMGIYVFNFLPRYAKTFVRRAKERFSGRKW